MDVIDELFRHVRHRVGENDAAFRELRSERLQFLKLAIQTALTESRINCFSAQLLSHSDKGKSAHENLWRVSSREWVYRIYCSRSTRVSRYTP